MAANGKAKEKKKKKPEERTNIAVNKDLHVRYLAVLPRGMKVKDQTEILIEDFIIREKAKRKK